MASTPLRRADLVADQRARPPFGHRQFGPEDPPVRVGATGTGEDLLVLVWSARDLAREIEAGARVLRRLGVRPGVRVGNTLPGALATPGALLLGDVNEAIGALDVPLGTAESDAAARAAWELVDRVQCQILVLGSETAETFLRAAGTVNRPWLEGVIWLRGSAAHATPPAPASVGGWRRTWLAVPEVASFAAGSCDHGALHLDGDVDADVVDGQLVLATRGVAVSAGAFATGISARPTRCECGAGGTALLLE